MICPKCHAQIPDDARECPKCHAEQSFSEPLDFSSRNERTIEDVPQNSGSSFNSKNLTFIMIAVLLLAVTMLIYYFFAANSAEDATPAAAGTIVYLNYLSSI